MCVCVGVRGVCGASVFVTESAVELLRDKDGPAGVLK